VPLDETCDADCPASYVAFHLVAGCFYCSVNKNLAGAELRAQIDTEDELTAYCPTFSLGLPTTIRGILVVRTSMKRRTRSARLTGTRMVTVASP
jgi:hypothetical protein